MTESKYKNWTQEQIDYLLQNYGKEDAVKIAKKIAKSVGAVYYILKKEEVNLETKWWKKEEVEKLKELYPKHSNKELEEIFSRSEDAIQLKAATLKLKKDSFWTDEETSLLKEMAFEGISYLKMAQILERTKSSVHNKLIEQKLTSDCRRWTDRELSIIKEMALSKKYTYSDIAIQLDATPIQIMGACRYHNWQDNIKRTISSGNDKMISLLKKIFKGYTLKQEYGIGERLRLDAYIKQLNLGFEYDGIQHFKHVPRFHKTKREFLQAQERDRRKTQLCVEKGIALIRIRYDEELSEELLREKIRIATTEDLARKSEQKLKKIEQLATKKKAKIQSKGFQKPKDGYKWPKRKLNS